MPLKFPRPADGHESWFGQHYERLLDWAFRLTEQRRERAEDLVHDAFVHFMASRPDLDAIENVDGYLYTMLRNLHLSNARRSARQQETVVSFSEFDLLDYDSLVNGMRAVEQMRAARVHEQMQHQLLEIWRYAQSRKTSSKSASVLILRFFHGYYPGEIAAVLQVSRDTVDQLLRLARKEARLFIADPEPRPDSLDQPGLQWPAPGPANPRDLPATLRDAILHSAGEDPCLDDARLESLYSTDQASSVATMAVAHIVSCGGCLDRVNRRLGLPPLADRHPLDSLGYDRDSRPPGGSGTGGGPGGPSGPVPAARRRLDEARRRLTDLLSHKPLELRIAINGVILGGQQVTSSVNRQTLSAAGHAVDFVEVFSEQDVRLLLLSVDAPPRGAVQQAQTVALSDGRSLDACVDFSGPSPVVRVSYLAPDVAPPPVPATAFNTDLLPETSATRDESGVWGRLRRWLSPARPSRRSEEVRWRFALRWRTARRGALTTVLVGATVAGIVFSRPGQPVLSATALLERSALADAAVRADRALVVHRTIRLDARRAGGEPIRRRVEVWHSAAQGVTVRRAYDEQDRLVAGEWTAVDGRRTVRRSRTSGPVGEPTWRDLEAWRVEPSADAFTRAIGGALPRAIATKDPDGIRIAIAAGDGATGDLVSAALTLGDDDRAVRQQIVSRQDGDITELVWTEEGWSTLPPGRVPDRVFEAEPGLAGTAVIPPAPPTLRVPAATAALELEALVALRRIDADLGEEVSVGRANGRVTVSGVVATEQRKRQVMSVLTDVMRNPATRLRIETVAEVNARGAGSAARPFLDLEPTPLGFDAGGLLIPVHRVVRQSLLASGAAPDTADEDVARVANRIIQQANRMRVHAWSLRQLEARFSARDVVDLDEAARQRWHLLIAEHANRLHEELLALGTLMQPVFPDVAAGVVDGFEAPLSAAAVRERSLEAAAAVAAIDEMVESAFTISDSTASPPAVFSAPRFWTLHHRAAALASTLRRSGGISQP